MSRVFSEHNHKNSEIFKVTDVFFGGVPNKSIRNREIRAVNEALPSMTPWTRKHFATRTLCFKLDIGS